MGREQLARGLSLPPAWTALSSSALTRAPDPCFPRQFLSDLPLVLSFHVQVSLGEFLTGETKPPSHMSTGSSHGCSTSDPVPGKTVGDVPGPWVLVPK